MASPADDALHHRVSWTLAALDLFLDMERNESDSRFAATEGNEIVYVFDEDVFEMFVGGTDQAAPENPTDQVYRDRRRAVGLFHIEPWRTRSERRKIDQAVEAERAELNRQSAMLTTEWLFNGILPGTHAERTGKLPSIYISAQHFGELQRRWKELILHYQKSSNRPQIRKEFEAFEAFSQDASLSALDNDEGGDDAIAAYIRAAPGKLGGDLASLVDALEARKDSPAKIWRAFWQHAFSRRLAATLAAAEISEPLNQLLRINSDIARRLDFVHNVMPLDDPPTIEESEKVAFWQKRLTDEDRLRSDRTSQYHGRGAQSIVNDAQTLAYMQSLANAAVRTKSEKRFVLVTSDTLILDVYRDWHCADAKAFEPFVLRTIRQYAPLLNVSAMSPEDRFKDEEWRLKEDIFPALKGAIAPFFLNLAPSVSLAKGDGRQDTDAALDEGLRLGEKAAHVFRTASRKAERERKSLREELDAYEQAGLIYSGAVDLIDDVANGLGDIIEKGRRIERTALGFGYEWLNRRLKERKALQDAQRQFAEGDETALASYVQKMTAELGGLNIDLLVRVTDIDAELERILARGVTRQSHTTRVPLALGLNYLRGGREVRISADAERRVLRALKPSQGKRGKEATFGESVQSNNIRDDNSYRLFAFYSCVALHIQHWDLAYRCAVEASDRAEGLVDEKVHAELSYLKALCIRFRIGAGQIVDVAGDNVTSRLFSQAVDLLPTPAAGVAIDNFILLRSSSERVALALFVCGWSLSRYATDTVRWRGFGPNDYRSELALSFELLDALFLAINTPASAERVFQGADLNEHAEVEEQIAANLAAAYCFATLAARDGVTDKHLYLNRLSKCSEALEWLDGFAADSRTGRRPTARIGQFYLRWFEFLRGTTRDPKVQAIADDFTLAIDHVIADEFFAKLL